MSIALLFMFHNFKKNTITGQKENIMVPQFPQLFMEFVSSQFFNVYVHLTDRKNAPSYIKKMDENRKLTLLPQYETGYGGFPLTQAMINMLEVSIKNDKNSHFIFLSETDAALFSPTNIGIFIQKNFQGKSWFNLDKSNRFYPDAETLKDLFKIGWYSVNAKQKIFSRKKSTVGEDNPRKLIKQGKLFLKNIRSEGDAVFDDIKSNKELFDELLMLISKHDQLGKYLSLQENETILQTKFNNLDYKPIPRKFYQNGRQQCMLCRNHVMLILKNMHYFVPYFKRQQFASDENFFISVLRVVVPQANQQNILHVQPGISYARFGVHGSTGSGAQPLNIVGNYDFFNTRLCSLFARKVYNAAKTKAALFHLWGRRYDVLIKMFNNPDCSNVCQDL